ncbi:hypothetical protein M1373_03095 [Candidatus Marsarchaeota archaeon]|nr:hypothetical protein [Candidatus Marsarchaeota archaeon]MCL5404726.1 hypothetical protein [Candidatus Marsarchaeota archaeon]
MNSYAQGSSFEAFESTTAILKTLKVRFLAFFAVLFVFYYVIFSYFHFGLALFGIGYYFYYILASSFVLSILAAFSLVIGLYSQKAFSSGAKSSSNGIYAFIISLVPSTMCCTPVIPSILVAVFGSGGIALASGAIQGLLSDFSPVFIVFAALLLYYSIYVSLKRLKKPSCKC